MTERSKCWYCNAKPTIDREGRWTCEQADHRLSGPERDSNGDGWDALQRRLADKCAADRPQEGEK
jgi:hypothetical protein